jgi:hypothetical protein
MTSRRIRKTKTTTTQAQRATALRSKNPLGLEKEMVSSDIIFI